MGLTMDEPNKKQSSCKKTIFWMAGFTLLLPIVMYLIKFNYGLSDSQDEWGQFGSYISGIYSPILTALTLYFLYKQIKLQELSMEQYHAQACSEDFNYYLSVINNKLLKEHKTSGGAVKSELIKNFSDLSDYHENPGNFFSFAINMNENKNFAENWSFLNGLIGGFKKYENTTFEHYYINSKLKAISILGWDCCAALDNFCYVISKREFTYNEFSQKKQLT